MWSVELVGYADLELSNVELLEQKGRHSTFNTQHSTLNSTLNSTFNTQHSSNDNIQRRRREDAEDKEA